MAVLVAQNVHDVRALLDERGLGQILAASVEVVDGGHYTVRSYFLVRRRRVDPEHDIPHDPAADIDQSPAGFAGTRQTCNGIRHRTKIGLHFLERDILTDGDTVGKVLGFGLVALGGSPELCGIYSLANLDIAQRRNGL